MRRSVSAASGLVWCVSGAFTASMLIVAGVASADTTVTLNVPKTQVVYATLRGGTYANKNISNILETRRASDMSYERRALLKFDTQNTIPQGSTVTSAELTIVVKDASADATRRLAVYQGTTSWTETEATWNIRRTAQNWGHAGGDMGTQINIQTVGTAGTKVTFDVTALVKEAVAGSLGSSRYTRIELVDLDAATSDSYRSYYTPDDATVSLRPKLTVTYGSASTPPPPPPSTTGTGTTLRVLEYNIHHNGVGTDGVYNPNRIADWIVKEKPDVVSLVEVESRDGYYSGDGPTLYKNLLEARTGVTWYSWDIQSYGDWTGSGIRNAILSRHPFISTYRHEFSIGTGRTIGGVTISVNGRNINLMSTHIDPYTESHRITECKELVPYAAGFAEDRIVTGDFNALPGTTEMGIMTAAYYDGWAEAVKRGIQLSAPDNPYGHTRNGRIDYIYYSHAEQHLTLKSVQVVDTRDANGYMPSDHRPLLAVFTVN